MTSLIGRVKAPTLPQLFVMVFALFGLLVALSPLSDNSTFLHLQTGKLILRTGNIPTADPYSFTAAGEPWVVQSWLASVFYGLAYKIGGLPAFVLMQSVLTMAAALLILRIAWAEGRTPVRRVVPAVIALACGSQLWSQRPLLFGVICLALLVLHVQSQWPLWVVPLIFIVWLNTHGSYPLGAAWLVLVLFGERIDIGRWNPDLLRRLAAVAATLAAACVVPFERRLVMFPLVLLRRSEVFARVQEWQSPDFHGDLLRISLLGIAGALTVLVAGKVPWKMTLPAVAFLGLSLWSARNLALLPVVLTGPLAASLRTETETASRAWERPRSHWGVALVLVVICAALAPARLAEARAVDDRGYPVKAVTFLERQGKLDQRIAADEFTGAYVILRYDARYRVWFDDRFDMYPVQFIEDHLRLHDGRGGAVQVLDRRGADLVLWKRGAPLAAQLSKDENWKRIYRDREFAVYERRGE